MFSILYVYCSSTDQSFHILPAVIFVFPHTQKSFPESDARKESVSIPDDTAPRTPDIPGVPLT
jgi:hypothetical protein